MLNPSTSFQVNGQWYDMPMTTCRHIQAYAGKHATNAELIQWVCNNQIKFRFGHMNGLVFIEPIAYRTHWSTWTDCSKIVEYGNLHAAENAASVYKHFNP